MKNKQIIIIMVQNQPGVLTKIASLCRRRRFNIESLTVSTTIREDISQITLVFQEDKNRIAQIVNQIRKIIEVIEIEAVEPRQVIDRELVLLVLRDQKIAEKILANKFHNAQIRLLNRINNNPILELTGEGTEIEHILAGLDMKKEVIKIARSGLVALKI